MIKKLKEMGSKRTWTQTRTLMSIYCRRRERLEFHVNSPYTPSLPVLRHMSNFSFHFCSSVCRRPSQSTRKSTIQTKQMTWSMHSFTKWKLGKVMRHPHLQVNTFHTSNHFKISPTSTVTNVHRLNQWFSIGDIFNSVHLTTVHKIRQQRRHHVGLLLAIPSACVGTVFMFSYLIYYCSYFVHHPYHLLCSFTHLYNAASLSFLGTDV
jgi:hypothetical protein